MHFTTWMLLTSILATSTFAARSSATAPQYPSPEPPRAGFYSSTSQKPVYTAQRARENQQLSRIEEDDDEPYPSTSSLGTARTTHGVEEQENSGFVQPIDFKTLLREVETSSKNLDSSSNPLFASESKNSFSNFFGANNNRDPFADFSGGLATASSERNTKNQDIEDSAGFVDPNVQFRSLFDSSQTASNGFKPEDFLENNQGVTDNSRGSQTRTFPSYTYTGRKEDDSPNRFRSSYRQPETEDDDYSNNYRESSDSDRDYEEESPRQRYNNNNNNNNHQGSQRYTPTTQATSHRPQSAGRSPKASSSSSTESKENPKCKKIEKTVDYENDDYSSFTEPDEPEVGYDPSTYRGRYKRQSKQGRQSRGRKRPMTCFVCEDNNGRYAEKCSFDSKANPDKGEYFHSSSSSFSDNGRRPSGKSDRHRRNPSSNKKQRLETSSATLTSVTVSAPKNKQSDERKQEVEEEESNSPRVIEKRQSGPDRYASGFGNNNNGRQRGNQQPRDEYDYQGPQSGGGDFDLPPRGYIGNNEGRGGDEFEYQPARGNQGPGGGNRDDDNFGFTGSDNDRDYGFGGGRNNGGDDFNFGPPPDFGRESSNNNPSSGGNRNPGFANFDFSIPKEYDPDIQLRGSNNNNRPNLDGSASNSAENFPRFDDDVGYDDYVKKNFPEFGPSSESSRPISSSSFQPSAGPPINRGSHAISHNPPSYRPRGGHHPPNSFNQFDHSNSPPYQGGGSRRGGPDKEHTQPSHNFAPPPNFYNDNDDGPQNSPQGFRGIENTEALNHLMKDFAGKDRSGCQKIHKGDMICYHCTDKRGMNKEECIYASNDPKGQKMSYHEVTEYSSDPPASILPPPPKSHSDTQTALASAISTKTVASPLSNIKSKSRRSPSNKKSSSVTRVESTLVTRKIHHENKSPATDYDFDY